MAAFKQQEWLFRGEGNRSLVLANCKEKRVYRLAKHKQWGKRHPLAYGKVKSERIHTEFQFVVDYMKNVMQPLLSHAFVVLPELVVLSEGQAEEAERQVLNSRPAQRKGKEVEASTVDPASVSALVLPDLCYVKDTLKSKSSFATVSVEIKPKKAFILESESVPDRAHVCKFCMHQRLKAKEGQWPKTSQYCPLDLFSGDRDRMKHALMALAQTPQNNLRICRNGEEIYGAWNKEDLNDAFESFFGLWPNGVTNGLKKQKSLQTFLDLVLEALLAVPGENKSSSDMTPFTKHFPSQFCQNSGYVQTKANAASSCSLPRGCVLEQVLSIQRLDDLDIQGVYPLHQELETYFQEHSDERAQWCLDGPYTKSAWLPGFDDTDTGSSAIRQQNCCIGDSVKKVKRFLLSKTVQDCSIMVALQQVSERDAEGKHCYMTDTYGRLFRYSVSIIDLDPKSFNKIPTYQQQEAKISRTFHEACTKSSFLESNTNQNCSQLQSHVIHQSDDMCTVNPCQDDAISKKHKSDKIDHVQKSSSDVKVQSQVSSLREGSPLKELGQRHSALLQNHAIQNSPVCLNSYDEACIV